MSEARDLFGAVVAADGPPCGKCGAPGTIVPGKGDHHAGVRCPNGHHWWLPKPTTTLEETERRRLSRLRSEVIERDGGACLICFQIGVGHEVHAGHLISRVDGRRIGFESEWIDATLNMAAMCAPCNSVLAGRSVDMEIALRHVGRCLLRGRWTLEQAQTAASFFFRAHLALRGPR